MSLAAGRDGPVRVHTVEERQIPRWKLTLLSMHRDPTEAYDGPKGRGMVTSVARAAAEEAFNKKVKGFARPDPINPGTRPAVRTMVNRTISEKEWEQVLPRGRLPDRKGAKVFTFLLALPLLLVVLVPLALGLAALPALVMEREALWAERESLMREPANIYRFVFRYYQREPSAQG